MKTIYSNRFVSTSIHLSACPCTYLWTESTRRDKEMQNCQGVLVRRIMKRIRTLLPNKNGSKSKTNTRNHGISQHIFLNTIMAHYIFCKCVMIFYEMVKSFLWNLNLNSLLPKTNFEKLSPFK